MLYKEAVSLIFLKQNFLEAVLEKL